MSCHYQYCMSGDSINNVLSNGNHTNDTNTTAPSSSLSVDAVTVAAALPWVRSVYSIVRNQVRYNINKPPFFPSSSCSLSDGVAICAYPRIQRVYSN